MTNTTETGNGSFHNFVRISITMQDVTVPVLSVVGMSGSVMALLLITGETPLKRLPSSKYLVTLSVSSFVFLATLFLQWVDRVFDFQCINSSNACCKLSMFCSSASDTTAVWIIVVLSVERFLIIYYPHEPIKLKFMQASSLICGAVVVACCVYNAWVPYLSEIVQYDPLLRSYVCGAPPDKHFIQGTLSTGDIFISCLIPSVLVFVMNLSVAMKVDRYHAKRARRYDSMSNDKEYCLQTATTKETLRSSIKTTRSNDGDNNINSARSNDTAEDVEESNELKAINGTQATTRTSYKARCMDMTKCMLLITTCFTALNLPSHLYRFVNAFWPPATSYTTLVCELVVYFLFYSHHALTFYLYAFHSPAMRKLLKPMFWRLVVCHCCTALDEDTDMELHFVH